MMEIQRTAHGAEHLYAAVLIAVDRGYVMAAKLIHDIERANQAVLLPDNGNNPLERPEDIYEEVVLSIRHKQSDISDILLGMDAMFSEISLNPFARFCYQKKWNLLKPKIRSIFVERNIYFYSIIDDFMRMSSMIVAGAKNLKHDSQRSDHRKSYIYNAFKFSETMADILVKGDSKEKENSPSFRTFLFLGTSIHSEEKFGAFSGSAMLADLIMTIPDSSEIHQCLMEYYIDENSKNQVMKYKSIFSAEKITPTLVETLAEMERRNFHYTWSLSTATK